ncbi:MAG: hypothetical protein KAS39_03400, partial [Actinomycetia bacterium]|nr:hypothetical protein [Actinomycetes bacterium]
MKEKKSIKKKKMLNKRDLNLLVKYFSAECSVDEKENAEKWIEADIKNQKTLELLKIFWDKKKVPAKKSDVNKCWKEVAEKAGITPGKVSGNKIIRLPILHRYKQVMRYAALLLLIILLPFMWKIIKTSFITPGIHEL